MVSVLGPLFRTAGHKVRTQFGVSPSDPARQKRGDVVDDDCDLLFFSRKQTELISYTFLKVS